MARRTMARKKRGPRIPGSVISICIISGIAALVLRMIDRRLQVPELGEVAGIAGAVCAICLLIMIGIWLVNSLNKK